METEANDFVVALDVGSSRTRCLVGEVANNTIRIVGRGEEHSRGVRRGEVVDLAAARYAVKRSIAAAEEQAGVDVQTLFLAVGSRHVRSFNNRACIGITREERTVTAKDVQSVLAAARHVTVRDDQFPIGTLVCSYAVDEVRQVREPEGMHGTRLEAEVHVITDARTAAENIVSCVDQARHLVESPVFGPYAAGEAVLDDDEKKLGVALIDIGAGTMGTLLYRDRSPVFSSVVPVGGDHITHDIAIGLELGLSDAAKLKEEQATLDPAGLAHPVLFERVARAETLSVDPRRLYAIVDCRVREMLDIVRRELLGAGVRPAGIRAVLTGGTSRLPGIESLAETVLGCPVRIGRPKPGPDAAPLGPEMATAVGLLRVGAAARKREAPADAAVGGAAGRVLVWLRQLL